MNIGERIKELRNNKHLTQQQLSDKSGISKNAIWNYEKNKRQPNIEILTKIAEALDVGVEKLFIHEEIDVNSNKTKIQSAIDKDIKKTILSTEYDETNYNLEMGKLYEKYFYELFNWKTLTMTPQQFFKFILSLSNIYEIVYLEEEDLNELSLLFYRFVQFKCLERQELNKIEESYPGHKKKYENINFFKINQGNNIDK